MGISYAAGPPPVLTITGYSAGTTKWTWAQVLAQGPDAGATITGQGSHYLFGCFLKIGDGFTATYFEDFNCFVEFADGIATASNQIFIEITNGAIATWGSLISGTRTSSGIGFKISETTWTNNYFRKRSAGTLNVYSCSFMGVSGIKSYLFYADNIYNCLFSLGFAPFTVISDIYNCTVESTINGMADPRGLAEGVTVTDCTNAMYTAGAAGPTFDKIVCRNNTRTIRTFNQSADCVVLDADVDSWVVVLDGTNSADVLRKYRFNLQVVDADGNGINGITVTIKDTDVVQVFTQVTATNGGVDGTITEQQIPHTVYSDGSTAAKNDHTLTLTGTGYESQKLTFTIDKPLDWVIQLVPVLCNSMHSTVNLMRSVA